MATQQQIIDRAQALADREKKKMIVMNLNPFGSLYVIRDYDERLLLSDKLVRVIEPQTIVYDIEDCDGDLAEIEGIDRALKS